MPLTAGRRTIGGGRVWLLPGEEFELALDADGGVSFHPPEEDEVLLLTTVRVIHIGRQEGRRVVTEVPLSRLDGAEVRQVERSPQRLYTSTFILAIGLILAIGIWVLLDVPLLALIVGGIIAIVGLWMLLGYLLDEEEGHLCFFAGTRTVRLPLSSHDSAQGAYQLIQRFFELTQQGPPALAKDERPAVALAEGGAWEHLSAGVPSTPLDPVPDAPSPEGVVMPPERQVLLEKLEEERGRLLERMLDPPEPQASRSPGEEEWSVKQNLAHVAEVEREFVAQALQGVRGDVQEVGHSGEEQWTRSQEMANERPLEDLLHELRQTRQDTVHAIQSIPEEALVSYHVRHVRMGELTLLQLLRVIYRHDRQHTDQVDQALRALSSPD